MSKKNEGQAEFWQTIKESILFKYWEYAFEVKGTYGYWHIYFGKTDEVESLEKPYIAIGDPSQDAFISIVDIKNESSGETKK